MISAIGLYEHWYIFLRLIQ